MAKFDITKFAEALPDRTDLPDSGMTREIALGDILDNPRNFYPRPDNKALAALMESIQANGLLEPPTVVPAEDGKYRLISGHSRMAALRLLAANRDEAVAKQFSTVLCRVLPAMTEEQELCAVIEANRQRVKSNALLAQEAEKLKETYIRRKKAGEKFPVGLREWIAKEMQINATKVGNLQVIKKGLKVPGILARWESGELPEAAALEIARMDDEMQYRLLDWMIDNHRSYAIKDVQEFVKSREAGAQASEDEKYIELLTYMRDKELRADALEADTLDITVVSESGTIPEFQEKRQGRVFPLRQPHRRLLPAERHARGAEALHALRAFRGRAADRPAAPRRHLHRADGRRGRRGDLRRHPRAHRDHLPRHQALRLAAHRLGARQPRAGALCHRRVAAHGRERHAARAEALERHGEHHRPRERPCRKHPGQVPRPHQRGRRHRAPVHCRHGGRHAL